MQKSDEKPLCVIETRVSDPRQLDGTHEAQEAACRRLAAELGCEVDRVWNTTVSGSLSERESFIEIQGHIKSRKGRVKYYIVYTIERLTRAGPAVYEMMKKDLRNLGVEIRDTRGVIQADKNTLEHLGLEYSWSKYSPSESQELSEASGAKGGKREMLTRMIEQEAINAREGYAVHPAPDGMRNERETYYEGGKRKRRTTRYPVPERACFYDEMFRLRAAKQKTDPEIVEIINAMGYLTPKRHKWSKGQKERIGTAGGLPLTVKHLQEIIQRPVYAGVQCEKFTHWKAVRAKYKGIVSIDTWNGANRGKWFIRENADGTVDMLKNYVPQDRLHDNPDFPHKFVPCPVCNKPVRGSSSRSKSGKYHDYYHCDRKINGVRHPRFSMAKGKFEVIFDTFVYALRFRPEIAAGLYVVLIDRFREQQAKVTQASADVSQTIAELKTRKTGIIQAFVAATMPSLRQELEQQIADIERQINVVQAERTRLEITEDDLHDFIEKVRAVMEHPSKLLLKPGNQTQRESYFGLMFEATPSFKEIVDGTPKLVWPFNVKSSPEESDSRLVQEKRRHSNCSTSSFPI